MVTSQYRFSGVLGESQRQTGSLIENQLLHIKKQARFPNCGWQSSLKKIMVLLILRGILSSEDACNDVTGSASSNNLI